MTYSLNTLNGDQRATAASVIGRFGQEIGLMVGGLLWVFWVLALISYSPTDAAWSTSGHGTGVANWGGRLGAYLADASYFLLGLSTWWLVVLSARVWLSTLARWVRSGETVPSDEIPLARSQHRAWFWLALLVLVASSCVLEWTRLHRFDEVLPGQTGGVLGQWLGAYVVDGLGFHGSALVMLCLWVLVLPRVFGFSWLRWAELIGATIEERWAARREKQESQEDRRIGEQAAREREEVLIHERVEVLEHPVEPVLIEPLVRELPKSARVVKERQKTLFVDPSDSKLPQVDLLDAAPVQQVGVDAQTLEMTSRLIEKKLKDFGVEVRVVAAAPGPVITRYEIEPATGVKGSQVVNLGKDLARSLSLVSIRVIETIPGKNLMALELPNAKRQTIRLSEILGSDVYNDAKSLLTMGLGKDIGGQSVVADLAKMPHCLVAGTTGSGKSVGINAMILSLLYKADAKDVRLLLIDPKMLEMSVYEGIPHLIAPVVTDMKHAANGLNWCVAEMEKRYKLMSKMGVRNLAGFNTKIDEAKARGEIIGNPFSLTPEQPEPLERLPYIVVVIDELADLMMVVGKKIEELIARLAQKARAAGIHLILATQRPSVDVITGLIKANIPTRLSFQVSSKIDSRTILDQMGAESLLGMGDMLYMPSGTGFPIRVHGAFVSDDEVHRVVAYLKEQGGEPNYIEGVLEAAVGEDGVEFGLDGGDAGGEKDALYDQAVAIVLQDRKASISYVQRKLKIGYNRAARLLEDMEKAGLVSALTSSGQRDILVRGDAS
jgi:S-DNA-T family DNA segregation ATPase FtsK/SpoIIIE